VNIVHGGIALVGGEAGHALLAAAEKSTEELVQMGEEEAGEEEKSCVSICLFSFYWEQDCIWEKRYLQLLGVLRVGRLVVLEGLGTAVVEEVDAGRLAAAVGRLELTVEVREQVDLLVLDHTLGQDTRDLDTDVGHGVCDELLVFHVRITLEQTANFR
jgi:hypothetical protein